jgi:hypothetical protein
MPMWLRILLARLSGRKVERHRLEIKLSGGQGDPDLAREIEAEVARQLAAGNDVAATRAALEDIAGRHGATLEDFKDD